MGDSGAIIQPDDLAGVCDPLYAPGTMEFYRTLLATMICVLGAATAAGLTMGLISLDELELMILVECSEDDCETQEEREELRRNQVYAKRVLPLVTRHHQLLVTLLLLNSVANESLPLFLDSLVPSWVAIVLSVSLILLFGEILPSAIFTGTSGLRISASLSPVVYVAMAITYPIVAPIAWVLDRWIHHSDNGNGARYNKAQLLALLRLHQMKEAEGGQPSPVLYRLGSSQEFGDATNSIESNPVKLGNHSSNSTNSAQRKSGLLRNNEVKMMRGAMNLGGTQASEIMTPIDQVYTLDITRKLDFHTLAEIVEKGHSRIPVIANGDPDDIRGILLTKKLTALSPEDANEVGSITLRPPTFVHLNDTLSTVLRTLKMSRSHLAIVTDNPREMFRRFDSRGFWRGSEHTNKDQESKMENVDRIFCDANDIEMGQQSKPKTAKIFGVVSLLDIIQQLVDDKLAEEDQFVPPLLSESWLGSSARWAAAEEVPIVVAEPRVEFGRLKAWATAVRSRFSARKYSSTGADLEQALLGTTPLGNTSFFGSNPFGSSPRMTTRRVSFSENVQVVKFAPPINGDFQESERSSASSAQSGDLLEMFDEADA